MGNLSFPVLPGLTWDIVKAPIFSTKIKRAVSLRELRTSYAANPLYLFTLKFEFLRDTEDYRELDQLIGLFCQCKGSWDSFLYNDPSDNTISGELIGVGNGIATQFLMTRTKGDFTEPVIEVDAVTFGTAMWAWVDTPLMWAVNDSVLMWAGDVDLGPFTVLSNGYIQFATPPPSGANVILNASFLFRCRFSDSSGNSTGDSGSDFSFNEFMSDLWELQSCSFVGSLGGKI